jgi:hypothetical protein
VNTRTVNPSRVLETAALNETTEKLSESKVIPNVSKDRRLVIAKGFVLLTISVKSVPSSLINESFHAINFYQDLYFVDFHKLVKEIYPQTRNYFYQDQFLPIFYKN